ncbi:MAG: hypothetical protein J4G05_04050 [Chlorobi bacterium]|nr:hypothetical protein [Chlorobiota bacterium]
MIRNIALSIMLGAFVGTVIGCGGGTLSEEERKAWEEESGEFATAYGEAQDLYAELDAAKSTMVVADMNEAGKAMYDEGSKKLEEYSQQLQAISEGWTKVTGAIGDGTDLAAWKSGVEATRTFITENQSKVDAIKAGLAEMKNMSGSMPAEGDDDAEMKKEGEGEGN